MGKQPQDATLLDVIIDGFEKNEIWDDFHMRELPLASEEVAQRKFLEFQEEARRWKGTPAREVEDEGRRLVAWPELEILQSWCWCAPPGWSRGRAASHRWVRSLPGARPHGGRCEMSKDRFDDNCKGCRPAMIDAKTKEVLADNHPDMVIALRLWARQPRVVKEAWHRVTCLNSRDPLDLNRALRFTERLREALTR